MPRQPLHVWLYGMRVGELTPNRSRKSVRFSYSDEALDTYDVGIPLLSCSLPVRSGAHDATGYFAGLLPEGRHLLEIADKAGVPSHDIHGILSKFGGDVVGALVVTTTTDEPESQRGEPHPLSAAELDIAVATLSERSLGLDTPGFGSPLSGFQDKCRDPVTLINRSRRF
jgi:serine/threonine-protein kinase HipA